MWVRVERIGEGEGREEREGLVGEGGGEECGLDREEGEECG